MRSRAVNLTDNHPSENTKPNVADIQMTKRLLEGGGLLEIKALDHERLGKEGFYSFGDEGVI